MRHEREYSNATASRSRRPLQQLLPRLDETQRDRSDLAGPATSYSFSGGRERERSDRPVRRLQRRVREPTASGRARDLPPQELLCVLGCRFRLATDVAIAVAQPFLDDVARDRIQTAEATR